MDEHEINLRNESSFMVIQGFFNLRKCVLIVDVIAAEIGLDQVERPCILWTPEVEYDLLNPSGQQDVLRPPQSLSSDPSGQERWPTNFRKIFLWPVNRQPRFERQAIINV